MFGNFQFYLRFYAALIVSRAVGNPALNYTDLIQQYVIVCGFDYICENATTFTDFSYEDISRYQHFEICPKCQCDDLCISRGDCCPDVYFRLPTLSCVNRTIIQANEKDFERMKQYRRLMVESCPPGSDDDTAKKCTSADLPSRFLHQPVTSVSSALVFANKFCAECNGVSSYRDWNLDFNCSQFADFNFVSTIDELIDLAFERRCTVQSIENAIEDTERNFNFDICLHQMYNLTKCNMTGYWQTYNENIRIACESDFYGQFRFFKNIFCFMCNPSPIHADDIITSCNTTGMWSPYDGGLETLCTKMHPSPYTKPFKNVFCLLCNRNNTNREPFIDIFGYVTETLVHAKDRFVRSQTTRYQYDVYVHSFNEAYLRHDIQHQLQRNADLQKEVATKDPHGLMKEDGTQTNMKTLLMHYVATFGNIGICPSRNFSLPSKLTRSCICNTHCIFADDTGISERCCLDIRLDYEASCRSEFEISGTVDPRYNYKGYLVTDGCNQEKTKAVFLHGCKNKSLRNILTTLPISANQSVLIDGREVTIGRSYDNMYCGLCNVDEDAYMNKLNGDNELSPNKSNSFNEDINSYKSKNPKPWDLELLCPHYLSIRYNIQLGQLLETAHNFRCRILYKAKTEKSDMCQQNYFQNRYTCDNFYKWSFADNDVRWACLNKSTLPSQMMPPITSPNPYKFDPDSFVNYRSTHRVYKNDFCSICKPNFILNDTVISKCNVTGFITNKTSFDESKCTDVGQSFYYYPFKNHYCSICNGMLSEIYSDNGPTDLIPGYDRIPGINWFPILRNMFSINQPTEPSHDDTGYQCGENQVFDEAKRICVNVTCYPGKFPENTTCVPLLKTTKMLRYTLALGVDISSEYFTPTVSDIVQYMYNYLDFHLDITIQFRMPTFEHMYVNAHEPCLQELERNSTMTFDIFVVLFLDQTVERYLTERYLINAMNTTISGPFTGLIYPLHSASDLPSKRHQPRDKGECFSYRDFSRPSAITHRDYRPIPVSRVLLCKYVILEENEFSYDKSSSRITLSRNGKDLEEGQFEIHPDGRLSVCLEELEQKEFFSSTKRNSLDFIPPELWYTYVACTTLSCICLIFSIGTYCIFPHLRTIPGIINMTTFITLLFSLLFTPIGMVMTHNERGCAVFGACLHFSWLCVFTTMQLCNFHMNRVFRSNLGSPYPSNIYRMIVYYAIYSFGLPALLLATNMTYSKVTTGGRSFGYGGRNCFIVDTLMQILTFLVPVGLIIVINIFLFVFTAVKICRSPTVCSTRRERSDVLIVLKMATITGVTWLLQLLDITTGISTWSYIATLVNGLQGVFVFLAFTVNSRVYRLYKNKYFSGGGDPKFSKSSEVSTVETKVNSSHADRCSTHL